MLAAMLAMLIAVAALPQAWAVVVDPLADDSLDEKLAEKYDVPRNKWGAVRSDILTEKLLAIPEDQLTVEELYYLEGYFSAFDDLEKTEYYFNLVIQRDPNYVPAYLVLARVYKIKGSTENNPELYKKGIELVMKTLEMNPDGIITDSHGRQKGQSLWVYVGNDLGILRDTYGYDIPPELSRWFYEVGSGHLHSQLKTREDLERIGFYEKRDEALRAMEKPPLAYRVLQALPGEGAAKGLLGQILVLYGFEIGVLLALLLFFVWFALAFRKADRSAAS
jgi:tetratricopeptide (TPR) repeat protein